VPGADSLVVAAQVELDHGLKGGAQEDNEALLVVASRWAACLLHISHTVAACVTTRGYRHAHCLSMAHCTFNLSITCAAGCCRRFPCARISISDVALLADGMKVSTC
jgi:hypothetical protein